MSTRKRAPLGFVLWEGESPVDRAPIVAIATTNSKNSKTGRMAQVWILRRDVSPSAAVNTGRDLSVCGHCPMRSPDGSKGRACYVRVYQAPSQVWRAFKAGKYPPAPEGWARGRFIRWGAYGDPAMLPELVVSAANADAAGWTGYTHQWRHYWASWTRGVIMASVETLEQERKARRLGWGTFRAGRPDGSDRGRTTLCASERTGISCRECLKCDGGKRSIYIPSHGAGRSNTPSQKRHLRVV